MPPDRGRLMRMDREGGDGSRSAHARDRHLSARPRRMRAEAMHASHIALRAARTACVAAAPSPWPACLFQKKQSTGAVALASHEYL